MLLLTLIFLSSCYYYRVNHSYPPTAKQLLELQEDQHYIILHSGDSAWHFYGITLKDSVLTGRIESLPESRRLYEYTQPHGTNRYWIKDESYVVNEVHIYSSSYPKKGNEIVFIPVKSILKLEVYEPDTFTTGVTFSVLGTLAFWGTLTVASIVLSFAMSGL